MTKKTYYEQRRVLRWLEAIWARLESSINWLTTAKQDSPGLRSNFNLLYVVDTLGIFLLIVLLVTGVYLTIVYRPGADRAYESLEVISSSWIGSISRSAHRYASDGLILVVMIHLIKMLFSDRFWGARWLAWVSGIAVLLLSLVIGVMGYFLIWDRHAQWLAEYFTSFVRGPIWITFASPRTVNDAFGFFVIILFLHVFLSLVIVGGMVIHEMRLQRPKVWSPRWVMAGSTVTLVALSIWKPVASDVAADVTQIVSTAKIDVLYTGFLALSSSEGGGLVWGVSAVVIIALCALPWLWKGRHAGPAYVIDEDCTGCAICARECPYNAIDIVHRHDESPHDFIAVVKNNMCTGCGLCVADCPTAAIELDLKSLSTHQIAANLKDSLARTTTQDEPPVVVFSCQRHITLGTMKGSREGADLTVNQPVSAAAPNIVSVAMPCAGMVQSKWIRDSLNSGVQQVIALTCPENDCTFREGPAWDAARLYRKRNRQTFGDRVHQLDITPGDSAMFDEFLNKITKKPATEEKKPLRTEKPALVSLSAGLILLSVVLSLSFFAVQPVGKPSQAGVLRIALDHTAEIKAVAGNVDLEQIQKNLPEGVSAEDVVGGERFPVRLRLIVDGKQMDEWEFEPRGLSREGAAYGLENVTLAPGTYDVRIMMMDDGKTWKEVFSMPVEITAGQVRILTYNVDRGGFVLD